jgi:microcystin-dependent protein
LSTALPLGFTFLFDSFRLWRHQYAGSQYGGSSSSFSPQGLTYDIPLHVSARGPLSSEKRNAHHHQSATSLPMHGHSLGAASPLGGIMVSQEHKVVVESSFGKDEKDEADKYSI